MADLSDWDLISSANEVLAALPETIMQVDGDFQVRTVNRPDSPIFRRVPASGDRLEEVFERNAVSVIAGLIDRARRTGGADAEGAVLDRLIAR